MDERSMQPAEDQDEGIVAYHGSPHDFDKFDLSKIGTGEGAQAYGHGLYFAEKEDLARYYRDQTSKARNVVNWVDKRTGQPLEMGPEHKGVFDDFMAANGYDLRGGDYKHQAEKLRRWADDREQRHIPDFENALSSAKSPEDEAFFSSQLQELRNDAKKYRETADLFDRAKVQPGGKMYQVHINAHPDHFLDWDKPMSEQSDHVKSAFIRAQTGGDPELEGLIDLSPESMMIQGMIPTAKGSAAYKTLAEDHGSQAAAARKLHEAGIKGIRYLDSGSRGAGEGSRNYVVFDDKLVSVAKKYADGGKVFVV